MQAERDLSHRDRTRNIVHYLSKPLGRRDAALLCGVEVILE
jgi:hypothetical protein